VAWFHCFAGVAGDMVLGSLIDAGADIDQLRSTLAGLPLAGWELRIETVERGGIGATRAVVEVEASDVTTRTYRDLIAMLEHANLPGQVADRSLAVLQALAEAESHVHRVPVDQVHLHELGGHDTVVDVVGSVAALEQLGIEEVVVSDVAVGMGMVRAAHGRLPNPSPAVVHLLRGAPIVGRDTAVELTTPTGAALMATWADGFGPMPAMTVLASGFGAGTADPADMPNCLQVVVGWQDVPRVVSTGAPIWSPMPPETGASGARPDPASGADAEPVTLVETTVDDVTGETLAHTLAALLQAGALDAWITPVVMKHGRPGSVVTALARPDGAPAVRRVLQRQTGTLGVRATEVRRWVSPRSVDEVVVLGQPIRVKVGPDRVKAEHRDVVRAAGALDLPVRQVAFAAEAAWEAAHQGASSGTGSSDGSG